MPTVVGSHSIASFVNPINGQPLNADIVKGNDNSLRASYVAHDADPGVHLQSSLLASRPAAGTAGRKWLTTDDGPKVWYDTGSVWTEIGYVPTTGAASLTDVTISGSLTVDTTTLVVDNANNRVGVGTATPGVALDVVGAARTSSSLTVTSGGVTVTGNSTITGTLGGLTGLTVASGGITVTGNSTITGTLGGLTGLTVASGGIAVTGNSTIAGTLGSLTGVTVSGTVTATTFAGSGASLTNLPAANITGTLPAISGANLTTLNASNLSSGTVASARLPFNATGQNSVSVNGINFPSTGSPEGGISLFDAATSAMFFSSGATFVTSVAPVGATTRYMNVLVGGVQYRIAMVESL